jgi:integrase/recombinase XerD
MSNPQDDKAKAAEVFNRDIDPQAKYEDGFNQLSDVLETWLNDDVRRRDYAEGTIRNYETVAKEWREFMEQAGRHPACASVQHVWDYVEWCEKKGNGRDTIRKKLIFLRRFHDYLAGEQAYPQSTDFNPFFTVKDKLGMHKKEKKKPPNLSQQEIGGKLKEVKHVRDRAIMVLQMKLGLRVSELCNIKLDEVHIRNSAIRKHYDQMGTAFGLNGRENAVYIPHDRERNKSKRPRVLPLDDEAIAVLTEYLLVRPDNGEPWVFLSLAKGAQLERTVVNDMWKKYWHPEYAESDRYRAITSHYGRHFFSTWFIKNRGWERELVQYMRGDQKGNGELDSGADAIDEYIHTYYDDIESRYIDDVFKFGIL